MFHIKLLNKKKRSRKDSLAVLKILPSRRNLFLGSTNCLFLSLSFLVYWG